MNLWAEIALFGLFPFICGAFLFFFRMMQKELDGKVTKEVCALQHRMLLLLLNGKKEP